MSRPNFFITEDNTAPAYALTCTRNGTAIDLSAASSVTLIIQNKSTGVITQAGKLATISSASNGTISYSADATDFPSKGTYVADISIDWGTGTEILYAQARWKVRTKIS